MIDLVAVNRLLSGRQFLSGPSDESFYNHLVVQIRGLARPGETLAIPDFNEAGAWVRAWALYQALLKRAPDAASAAAEEISRTALAHSLLMNELAADRQALRDYRDRNRTQWSDLAEYVGISDADLEVGEIDARFGVEACWEDKARRIGGALQRIQGMSPGERADIPRRLEEHRRREFLRDLDRRITALEQANDRMAEQLGRLEKIVGSLRVAA